MDIEEFKEMMCCNEPEFMYNGEKYSICNPDGNYYVLASDSPGDEDLVFETLDDLLENWIIQGKPLKEILPEANFDY